MRGAMKAAGAIITIVASGLAGLVVAHSYRAHVRRLAAWVTALSVLETEISFGLTRLGQAMRRAGQVAGQSPGQVLVRAAELLEGGECGSAGACLSKALAEERDSSNWLWNRKWQEDMEAVVVLGEALGMSNSSDQARHIALASRRLEMRRQAAEEAATVNYRLWSVMGFLIGGMVAIALL
ncbi:MAG: hypothetical protein GX460_02750 [Firmicutes bacterium]|nr:hypothetical protein [Bacillota bacterium]